MGRLRVFVIDGSTVSAAAIRLALNHDPNFEYCGSAASAAEGVQRCQGLRPDVITLDLSMPEGGGLDMLAEIKAACPTPVVIVSAATYEGSPVIPEAFMRGADACFDKGRVLAEVETFLAVLRLVCDP
jgi:chemotaxis response regulator CheB